MKKILVINVNWVGDVIFSSPVFKALKETYPQASISCMAVPRVREILEHIPEIDEIIEFDEKGRGALPWVRLKFILELRKRRFDGAFFLHGSRTRAILIYMAGIPVRAGYALKRGRDIFLTHNYFLPENIIHRSDYYLNVIESFGIKVADRTNYLKVSAKDKEAALWLLREEGLAEGEDFVAVHVGGNWDLKRWPQANFAKLINKLMTVYKKKVVISGGREDFKLVCNIADLLEVKPIVLAGKTSLSQLIGLLHLAACIISADSGPIHIASSVGTPVISIFGPTKPLFTAPRGKGSAYILHKDVGCNRQACYFNDCPDNICMKAVTVEDVLQTFEQIRS